MRSGTLIAAVCICLLLVVQSALGEKTMSGAKWKIGTPIVTYWAGPGDTIPLDDRTAAQLRAGGWNLGWTKKPADLDLYHRYGIRVMLEVGTPNVDDPAQAKALDAVIDSVSTHPALYSYYLVDEPGAGAFPKLGKLVAHIRRRDPAHLPFINLLPTYASEGQLQVSADKAERAKVGYPTDFAGVSTGDETVLRYREHLKRFVETVHPDLISYDHYHFLKNSDGAQYFLNLALIRMAAQEAKVPFMNIIQTCDSPAEGWRGPGEHELRWLTYTSLAYGAQAIAHFRYDVGLWKERDVPLPLYWALCGINREFVAIATELQPLKSLGVYHCGKLPVGGKPLPPRSVFTPEPKEQELLLGTFGKSANRPTHVVVVNLDYKSPVTTTLTGPGPMEVFHAPTNTWHAQPDGKRITLNLPPGGGALVRVKGTRF
jgi:hypothetical protein